MVFNPLAGLFGLVTGLIIGFGVAVLVLVLYHAKEPTVRQAIGKLSQVATPRGEFIAGRDLDVQGAVDVRGKGNRDIKVGDVLE
jgi:hypothetical protein